MAGDTKTALIFGVTGQDGSYLARHLVDRGYDVHGTSRDREIANLEALKALRVLDDIELHSAALTDFRSVLQLISDVRPSRIFQLAGQSSVGLSFETPVETLESIATGTLNVLESMRFLKSDARLYHASSSESFGNTVERPATEGDPFRPTSPYGIAKAAAHWAVANYRQAYGLFACSGITFNHESPLRPARFVTQKIVRGAADIKDGKLKKLKVGNMDVQRDWGWAPEYVEAMARMLDRDEPDDFILATGATHKLEDFVARAFAHLGLDWREHVERDPSLERPLDLAISAGKPDKAKRVLGWTAQAHMPEVVERLMEAEARRRAG